jgi:hypothetical protein
MKSTKKDWLELFLLFSIIIISLFFIIVTLLPIWLICWTGFICFFLIKKLYIDKKFKN